MDYHRHDAFWIINFPLNISQGRELYRTILTEAIAPDVGGKCFSIQLLWCFHQQVKLLCALYLPITSGAISVSWPSSSDTQLYHSTQSITSFWYSLPQAGDENCTKNRIGLEHSRQAPWVSRDWPRGLVSPWGSLISGKNSWKSLDKAIWSWVMRF